MVRATLHAHARYRQVVLPDFPKHLFTVKFILGTPAYPEKPISSEGVERSKFMREIQSEMKEHGDMIMLDVRVRLPRFDSQIDGRWWITSIWARRTSTSSGSRSSMAGRGGSRGDRGL